LPRYFAVCVGLLLSSCAPPSPPTAIVLATSERESLREYSGIAASLPGWRILSIDLPAHGDDRRPGELKPLAAWRTRLDAGEDLIGDFAVRLSKMVDGLPNRPVAVIGVSRGGFLALHAAARDPRITAVVAFMPVTHLGALDEFGDANGRYDTLDVAHLAPRLVGRSVWMSIGRTDTRASTAAALTAAEALEAPLLLEAESGHHYSQLAERAAATWLLDRSMPRSAMTSFASLVRVR